MNDAPEPGDRRRHDPPGTTIERVRLNHPRDLLSAIPYLLGFHPADSVVVIALHRGQVALTVRVDAAAVDDAPAAWARLSRALTEAGTDALAVVAYTAAEAEHDVLRFAGASPWPVLDVIRAHGGRWWSLTCPNGPACCPPGEPYTLDPAVTAPLAVGSGPPAASRDDLAACLRPGPRLLVDAVAALLPLNPEPAESVLAQATVTAHTERLDGPIPLGPAQAALLLHAISVIPVRDSCCARHDDAAWWLWTDLIRAAPPGWVAPVATLIAVTAYQRGNAILAQLAAGRALTDDPDYRLAQLVDGMAAAQIHPQIVRDALDYAVREATAAHRRADAEPGGPENPTADDPTHDPACSQAQPSHTTTDTTTTTGGTDE